MVSLNEKYLFSNETRTKPPPTMAIRDFRSAAAMVYRPAPKPLINYLS